MTHAPHEVRIDARIQFARFLAGADIAARGFDNALEGGGFHLGDLRFGADAAEQQLRQRIGEVIGHEIAGTRAFAGRPAVFARDGLIGDGGDQPGVELLVNRHQQTGFGAEVVVERTGAQPGSPFECVEIDHAIGRDQLRASGIE